MNTIGHAVKKVPPPKWYQHCYKCAQWPCVCLHKVIDRVQENK